MTSTYRDMTGVLALECITPVIKALFGSYSLDDTYPGIGKGKVFVACIAESSDVTWSSMLDRLRDLAAQRQVTLGEGEEEGVEEYLYALAAHFGAGRDGFLNAVIENIDLAGNADLEVLFDLAIGFDDGHGLKSNATEAAWHCDRPRLGEFGGYGEFCGRHAFVGLSSSDAVILGGALDSALEAGDIDQAAKCILDKVEIFLSGIADAGAQDAVRKTLCDQLMAGADLF
ncbi:hypothetical protein RY831_03775 [Noviherbaspirillum sp. CPCC 100848]|uniref:Uncharacterized protein n=1 Tax=Noviherbaspirillum album TaxID=3080276 RepID=A0ABU6J3P5_9BURK|nr:hypothetical protein [Noviherbaspirillum sp. CPCC 100848]MEC4718253.1 hypothetical protein [Noviherbaspirillum sp. CPCC 100848]